MKLGIIGYGAIGSFVARSIKDGLLKKYNVSLVFDLDEEKLEKAKKDGFRTTNSFEEFLNENLDMVMESASQKAAKLYLPDLLKKGLRVLVMSGGVFSDMAFKKKIDELAEEYDAKVYVPSGAISGLDGIEAMKFAGELSVLLETRKNPRSLGRSDEAPVLIFEGGAKEAAEKFPKNINVAMALALATEHPENVKVRIISDPNVHTNTHTIVAEGKSGKMKITVENVPFPENPKTSFLAALSALQILKKITQNFIIGG